MHIRRFALGLAAAAVLAAQPMPRPGAAARPGITAAKDFLGLSDQQVQQLVQLRREEQQALPPIRGQVREKAQALREARQTASPDPTTVGQLTIDLQNLRKQVTAMNESYHTKALALLDASQKEKLETLQQAVQRAERARPVINGATALNLFTPPQPRVGAMRDMPAMRPGRPL